MGVDLDLEWAGIVGQGRRSKVKVKCQKRVLTPLLPCFKVKGRGQGQRSRSKVKVTFWRAAVDIRGSALPSALKSNKSHCQSNVCVSINSQRVRG